MSIRSKHDTEAFVTVRLFESICDKRSKVVSLQPWGRTALEYVPEALRKDPALRIVVNGQALYPDEFATTEIAPGSEVVIAFMPHGGELLVGLGISLALTGISMGVNYALAPSISATDRDLEDSPTYGWDGISNTIAPGTILPIVYGEHRIGGHVIEQFSRHARNPPAEYGDPQAGELHTLLALCAGPVEDIDEPRANGNPLDDFGGSVSWETRFGADNQAPLEGFRDVTVAYAKDQALTYADVDGLTFTTTGEVDAFEVVFRFPNGCYSVSDKGVYSQRFVGLTIQYQEDDSSTGYSVPEYLTLGGKTRSAFDAWYRSPTLPRAKYQILVKRITVDDTGGDAVSTTNVHAINEITEECLTYPKIALLAVRQLPTNQVSGAAPTYDCVVKGRKVRVYSTTTTYTEEWSDNPAWCLLDLLTDPFNGLGAWVTHDKVDLQAFLDWAAFCVEEDFRLDIVLDGSLAAVDAIKQICMTGRANFALSGDTWTVKIEKEEEPVQLFAMGRIHKDSFSVAKTARSELANFFVAEFWNRDLDYQQDSLPREDPTLTVDDYQREKTINLLGTTRIEQAQKLLNFFVLSNRLLRRRIEFEEGVDALALEAGDVFKAAHDVPGWGWSGKILAVEGGGSTILLDREITFEAGKTYELTAIHSNDAIDVVRVTNNPETTRLIHTSADWSQTPIVGLDYALGEVAASTVLYRCTSISRSRDPTKRKIRAIEYNPAIYGEDLTVLPAPSVSRLPDPRRIPSDVTDLRLEERTYYAEDGTLSAAIDVHFTLPAEPGVGAQVFWRRVGDYTWEAAGPTVGVGFFSISNDVETPGVEYEVSVVSVSQTGNRKSPELGVQASILMLGSTRQPSNVVGFTADRTLEGLVFTWEPVDPVVNFDLAGYEIRNGTNWKTATIVGRTTDTSLRTGTYVSGTQTYLLRAKNTAGRYSPADASVVIAIDGRIGENVILTRSEAPTWSGSKVGMTVDSGDLVLATSDAVVAWRGMLHAQPLRSSLIPGGYGSGFRFQGSYTSDAFQVATAAVRCLVATDVVIDQVDQSFYWDSPDLSGKVWESEYARQRAWSEAPDDRVKTKVEMRFSTTTSDDSAFGAWQERPQNIEVQVKWAQVRLLVEVTDPTWTVEVSQFDVLFDVPDVVDGDVVTTSDLSTVAVTFNKDFLAEPKVTATVIGATAGDEIFLTSKDADGFYIEVKNGGSRVVRTVNYTAIGY